MANENNPVIGNEDFQKSYTHENPKPKTNPPQLNNRQNKEAPVEKKENNKK